MSFHKDHSGFVLVTIAITTLVIGLILNVEQVNCASSSVFDKGIPPDKSAKDKTGAIIDGTRGRSNSANVNNNNANLFENNNHNNELHSTNFNFHDIGDEDLTLEDHDGHESDADYYNYDDNDSESDIHLTDDSELNSELEHEPAVKPKIGKCCPYGQGLNVQGKCKDINPIHLQHHEKQWFPDKVYDGTSMMDTNISEWEIIANHRIDCRPNESTEIVSDMARFAVLKDGRLYLAYTSQFSKFIPALEFCMDQELGKGEGRVIRSCFSRKDLCGDRKCLRKCCPEGAVVEEPSARCSNAHVTYNNEHVLHHENWTVIHATPSCANGQHLANVEGFNVSDDGSLITGDINAPFLHYCLDHFLNVEDANKSLQLKALICFKYKDEPETRGADSYSLPKGVRVVYGLCFIISALCLAFAAAISWRLPELRSLHGKCQLSHLGTLFCLFIFLGTVHLGTNEGLPEGLCTFVAVMIHICGLSSFMWLNLLCVNIYLTFRSLRPPLAARRDENRRLFFLCVYAWGIPAAFCIFLYILDSSPGNPGRLDPMPQPMYGVSRCLMSNRQAEFAYFFGPVGVLLLCNGLLFCLTAQELLCGLWRLDNAESLTFRRKSMGIVVAKLGIVMGMGWILDVLSWAVGRDFPYVFYAADFFNALQGVFICLVLIWRKRVLEVLHIRKPSLTKDETLTARPFLPKNSINNSTLTQADHDTSLVIVQES